ncbi:hypothetical protein Srufu_002160 [Streptomyces libani subsp. rufus]|nr:hypothetical protein Srufu_002160 [Streptomyces libani subsp. rufus]
MLEPLERACASSVVAATSTPGDGQRADADGEPEGATAYRRARRSAPARVAAGLGAQTAAALSIRSVSPRFALAAALIRLDT